MSVDDDDDETVQDFARATPAYKRALWTVVLLNVGTGIAEVVAGFISGSQALKADALDFLGDGTLTFLGLMAIGWSLMWRARAALLQGLFLGGLGCGVLATSAYRIFVLNQPEADIMGLFGLIALLVNVFSAWVLLPYRTGDANVRAVWLFSRNDAIGNFAVIAAAGLVAWTGTAWPDLTVATVIAGLFLQSSWSIVRNARRDLSKGGGQKSCLPRGKAENPRARALSWWAESLGFPLICWCDSWAAVTGGGGDGMAVGSELFAGFPRSGDRGGRRRDGCPAGGGDFRGEHRLHLQGADPAAADGGQRPQPETGPPGPQALAGSGGGAGGPHLVAAGPHARPGAGLASGRARRVAQHQRDLECGAASRLVVQKRMARPVRKRLLRGDLTGLRQRIRSRGEAPGQDGFPRTLVLIKAAASSAIF